MSLSLLRRRAPSTDAPRDDLMSVAARVTGSKRSEITEVTPTLPGLLIVANGERLILTPADRPDAAGRTGLLAVDRSTPVGPPQWQPRRGDDLDPAPSTAARWALDDALAASDELPSGRSPQTVRLKAVADDARTELEALQAELDELPNVIRRLTDNGDVDAVLSARRRLAELPDVIKATQAHVSKLRREADTSAAFDRDLRDREWERRMCRLLVDRADELDAAVAAMDAIAAEVAVRAGHVGGGDTIDPALILEGWRTTGRDHYRDRCAALGAEIVALRHRAGITREDAE